jgi:hypothetical protein
MLDSEGNMAAKLITIPEVKSGSLAPVFNSVQFSLLTNSYPDDIESALALTEITMTGNGEREKAFKRAGLR